MNMYSYEERGVMKGVGGRMEEGMGKEVGGKGRERGICRKEYGEGWGRGRKDGRGR